MSAPYTCTVTRRRQRSSWGTNTVQTLYVLIGDKNQNITPTVPYTVPGTEYLRADVIPVDMRQKLMNEKRRCWVKFKTSDSVNH